jgi:O-antigen/teichoic acid export membrane protein
MFVPALLGLAVVAHDFVYVALGARWSGVAPLLQIMAIGVLAQAVSAPGAEVLKALGRASTLLWFTIGETVAFLVGVIVGLQWGILGAAAAYTAVAVPARLYFVRVTAASVGLPLTRFAGSLAGVAQAALALLAATLATSTALSDTVAPWLRLVIVVAVGIAVYVPVCAWRAAGLRDELLQLIRGALGRRAASPAHGVADERSAQVSSGLLG